MVKNINSFVKLERALSETQYALHEVIEDLRKTPPWTYPPDRSKPLGKIIPHYVFEAYREQHQSGENLDRRYAKLLSKERELRIQYLDPDNAGQHNSLLTQLEAIQQAMTEILQQFDPPDNEA